MSDHTINLHEMFTDKPTTGEWTVVKLASYIDRDGRLDDKRLLADINAALAAEREESAKWRSEAHKTNELRQQLAAERENGTRLACELSTAKTQLAAAREIVDKVWQALGVETFEQAKGKAIWELVYAERKNVEECTRLLALAQEQQVSLVTDLKICQAELEGR